MSILVRWCKREIVSSSRNDDPHVTPPPPLPPKYVGLCSENKFHSRSILTESNCIAVRRNEIEEQIARVYWSESAISSIALTA